MYQVAAERVSPVPPLRLLEKESGAERLGRAAAKPPPGLDRVAESRETFREASAAS